MLCRTKDRNHIKSYGLLSTLRRTILLYLYSHLFYDLLFLALQFSLYLLDIWSWRKLLGDDTFVEKELSDVLIIFRMIDGNTLLSCESLFCDIMIRECCREVFRLQCHRRKMICEWLLRHSHTESTFHILSRESSEKCSIATTSNPSKSRTIYPPLIEQPWEYLLCIRQTLSCLDSLDLFETLFDELELASRESKIAHRKSYLLFAGITILCYEIASIACQSIIVDDLSSSFPAHDWFVDASKVICRLLFRISTSYHGSLDDEFEVTPCRISEQVLKLTSIPELDSLVLMTMRFECGSKRCEGWFLHTWLLLMKEIIISEIDNPPRKIPCKMNLYLYTLYTNIGTIG